MSQQPSKDRTASAPPAKPGAERESGAARVDERGHAAWEWAVKTGMFDRSASRERVRTLIEDPADLKTNETPNRNDPPKRASGNPYERVPAAPPAAREPAGSDPYSRGPARTPERTNFNPYQRTPPRKP